MAENPEKNKSGVGKFFLGIGLGAIAGAIASKFIKVEVDEDVEEFEPEEIEEIEEKPVKKPRKNAAKK